MNTPIVDFVKKYADSNSLRLHMPGHKGKGTLGFEKYDITEIDGADVLYSADGIIAASQNNAAKLFDTDDAGMISRRSGAGTGVLSITK